MITRRNLFGILAGAIAAPVIVRLGLIMPIRALKPAVSVEELFRLCMRRYETSIEMLADEMANDLFRSGTCAYRLDYGPSDGMLTVCVAKPFVSALA